MTSRVYVLCAIDYGQFNVIGVYEALTDATSFGNELISLAPSYSAYQDAWTETQGDPRFDLFIREFTNVPTYGSYLSVQEFTIVPWSKSPEGTQHAG